jgi:hypothetical protein
LITVKWETYVAVSDWRTLFFEPPSMAMPAAKIPTPRITMFEVPVRSKARARCFTSTTWLDGSARTSSSSPVASSRAHSFAAESAVKLPWSMPLVLPVME